MSEPQWRSLESMRELVDWVDSLGCSTIAKNRIFVEFERVGVKTVDDIPDCLPMMTHLSDYVRGFVEKGCCRDILNRRS